MLARLWSSECSTGPGKPTSITSHSHGGQTGTLVPPHLGLSIGCLSVPITRELTSLERSDPKENIATKVACLSWLSLRSHKPSLPQYLIEHTGQP